LPRRPRPLPSPALPVALALGLGAAACAPKAPLGSPPSGNARGGVQGPPHAALPLWRSPVGNKLYIEADLGDGVPRLFLVDTGADISALTAEAAAELGLPVAPSGGGPLAGLGGEVRDWQLTVAPEVSVGPYDVPQVRFAVGVPGVPDRAGLAEVAGILGNNIWGHFQLVIDYPANTLELWRGGLQLPPTATSMWFDGHHARAVAELRVRAPSGELVAMPWTVEVDTGAVGLLLVGDADGSGAALRPLASRGEEPIYGVGAPEGVGMSYFLRPTLRLPLESVAIGGAEVGAGQSARWVPDPDPRAALQLSGLAGHELFDGKRLILDFPGRQMALVPSERPAADRDVHAWALRQLRGARGRDDRIEQVRLLAGTDEVDAAHRALLRLIRDYPDDTELRVALARMDRHLGRPADALELLKPLGAGDLVDAGELLTAVSGLQLAGDAGGAAALCAAALEARPDSPEAWVAEADLARARGELPRARAALAEASRHVDDPEALLLRRARLAWEEGDRYGALTHLRRVLQLHPAAPIAPWIYAWLVDDSSDEALLVNDLMAAQARLHPGEGPLDFFAAAWRLAGDPARARAAMDAGLKRDCPQAPDPASRANCEAWYRAVAGVDLDAAQRMIDEALAARPHNREFLDTLAVLREARGDLPGAREAARRALELDPADLYLQWQHDRLHRTP